MIKSKMLEIVDETLAEMRALEKKIKKYKKEVSSYKEGNKYYHFSHYNIGSIKHRSVEFKKTLTALQNSITRRIKIKERE